MHIHTKYSKDSNPEMTLDKIVEVASSKGFTTIGLTDHSHPDTDLSLFAKLRNEIKKVDAKGVQIFRGTEADVLNDKGQISVSEGFRKEVDYIMAGPHHINLPYVEASLESIDSLIESQHRTLMNVIKNPLITCIAHPWWVPALAYNKIGLPGLESLEQVPSLYLEEFAVAVAENEIPIEVNARILMNRGCTEEFSRSYREFVRILQGKGAIFFMGSDSHSLSEIGNTNIVEIFFKEIGVDETSIWYPTGFIKQHRSQ